MVVFQVFLYLHVISLYSTHRHELEQYGPDGLYTITYQAVNNDEDNDRLQEIDEAIQEHHARIAELFEERNRIIQRNYHNFINFHDQWIDEQTQSPSNDSNLPTRHPTETPTNSPTFKPTKSPTLKPTKHPTLSPTSLPTSQPTIKWASKPPKNTKSARRPKHKTTKNVSANTETDDQLLQKYRCRHHPQSHLKDTITFYEADAPLRHEFERDLPRNYPDDLLIVANFDALGLPDTDRIKSYHGGGACLFNHISEFNDCFRTHLDSNGTPQHSYDPKMIQEWVKDISYSMGAGGYRIKRVFDDAYGTLCIMYEESAANNQTVFQKAILAFIKRSYEFADKQRMKCVQEASAALDSILVPYIRPDLFQSCAGLNLVLDYYTLLFDYVIRLEKKYIISMLEPIKFMNITGTELGLNRTTGLFDWHLLRSVSALKDWLVVDEDHLQKHQNITRIEASNIAFERIATFRDFAHQWRFYKKCVDVARAIYDWKNVERFEHLNIHIPWAPMDGTEWEVMRGMLFAFGFQMPWFNIDIMRYNITLPAKRNKGRKHKSTKRGFAHYTLTLNEQVTLTNFGLPP